MSGEKSPLDGIDATTPRTTLLQRLRDAAAEILKLRGQLDKKEHKAADERVARLQEIEENVARKWAGRQQDVVQLLVSNSEVEWGDVVEFLGEFREFMPVGLRRIYEGAKLATGKTDPAEPAADKVTT